MRPRQVGARLRHALNLRKIQNVRNGSDAGRRQLSCKNGGKAAAATESGRSVYGQERLGILCLGVSLPQCVMAASHGVTTLDGMKEISAPAPPSATMVAQYSWLC